MTATTRRAFSERLKTLRARGPHYFARRCRSADEIARLAYNSSVIEGRNLSRSRLREVAQQLIESER
jgi:hypothetical protein